MSDENKKILKDHTKRLDRVDEKLDRIDNRLDNFQDELLDHRIRLDRIEKNMVPKQSFDELCTKIEFIYGEAKKREEESSITVHRYENLDQRVVVLEEDVNKKIKPALQLS